MSQFQAPIDGHTVIPGTYTAAGGITNFNLSGLSIREPPAQPCKPFSTVPFAPDRDFVERPEVLAWMRDKCAGPGARAALVGIGGVGKSQLAIQYAHNVYDTTPQPFVFWVHASTRARFEQAYRDLADRLGLLTQNNPNVDVLRLVYNWLCDESNGKWTMILDNVDDAEVFFPSPHRKPDEPAEGSSVSLAMYLPQSRNGSILITSRNKDTATRLTGGSKYTRDVYEMEKSQALQLLRNKLQDTFAEEDAIDLLCVLDYMPLAITQAAAYINRRARMTISGYLVEFRQDDKKKERLLNWEMGDIRRDGSASNSVVTTWRISFSRIYEERRSAANLLSLMSFFNPQGIPEKILRKHHRRVAESEDEHEEGDTISEFDEDLDTLRAYSLVASTKESDICEMHALVQFCTRIWLSSNADRWKQEFLAIMAQEFPPGDFEHWAQCQQLLPHIESLYDTEPARDDLLKDWAQILTNAAWYIWKRGSYGMAHKIATKALIARERVLGPENNLTLVNLSLLGLVLRSQGKYSEAEKLIRRALEGYEKYYGIYHQETLTGVGDLALVLQDQGKFDEAEKLNRHALQGREKKLGTCHLYTLTSVNHLAHVLRYRGKHNEAEMLNRRALAGYEKELGMYHPDTLMSARDLALVLQDQGKYDEAEKLNRRAMEGYEKEFGIYHPETLTSVNNLARVLRHQRKHDESEKLGRQALEGYEKQLGIYHPNTLTSANDLAMVLHDQRKFDEAEKLNRRAMEGYEKELGMYHPATLTSVGNLALVLQGQGKYDEAEDLNRRALEGREKTLGVQHPHTLMSVFSLAHLLHECQRYEESIKLYIRACDGFERQLGPQHPTTIACLTSYSSIRRDV